MSHFTQQFAFFFDIETAYDTDPTIAVTDAMIISGEQPSPINGGFVERTFRRGGFYGARPQVPVNRHQQFVFNTELTGTNEVTTPIPPPIGKLLRACGMLETPTATTDVTYTLQNDPALYESGWGELYNGTNKWTFNGSRGNMVLNFPENNFPNADVTLMSKYTSPVAQAAPGAPDLTLWLPPTPVSEDFTTTLTFDGIAIEHVNSSFDFGMNVIAKDRPNVGENIIITDVAGNGTLSWVFAGVGTSNWVEKAVTEQKQMPLQIVQVNPTENWRLTIDCPQIQITGYTMGNANEEVTEEATIVIGGDSANNAFQMTFDLAA